MVLDPQDEFETKEVTDHGLSIPLYVPVDDVKLAHCMINLVARETGDLCAAEVGTHER